MCKRCIAQLFLETYMALHAKRSGTQRRIELLNLPPNKANVEEFS